MNTTMTTSTPSHRRNEGFTLVEILIAIVVVGILAAVAIIGISSLTSTGSKSACNASLDAAKGASSAFYANNSRYPENFTEFTGDTKEFVAPSSATVGATTVVNGKWTLTGTFSGTGATMPTFVCSVSP